MAMLIADLILRRLYIWPHKLGTLSRLIRRAIRSIARPELPINDDPPARDLLIAYPQHADSEPLLIPRWTARLANRHGLVERFENADRSGNLPNLIDLG
jgi:hypothetical protein